MARSAIKAQEDPKQVARVAAAARLKARKSATQSKTFETLTPAEKDKLLKALAVRAGLIQDSDDS
jgi:hypothetical protein